LKIIPAEIQRKLFASTGQLAGTENRIAVERRRYNERCRITTRLLLSFRTAGGEHERIHSQRRLLQDGGRCPPGPQGEFRNAERTGTGSDPQASACKTLKIYSCKGRIFRTPAACGFPRRFARGLPGVHGDGIRGFLKIGELAGKDLLVGEMAVA